MPERGGMAKADFIEWIKADFREWSKVLKLLRSKLFLLSLASHPIQILGVGT